MAGLAPPNLRLPDQGATTIPANDTDVIIQNVAPEDMPEIDDKGAILKIEHGDGSVTISMDGRPLSEAPEKEENRGWFANLAEKIDDIELGRIADDLIRGIQDDLSSREEWVQARATGIQLLGLKIEVPGVVGAADGAPVEGMSKVRHPLLLEAVLRFQANARSEMLPTDGPVKIRDDSNGDTIQHDQLADALQKDANHYLTSAAPEYYPDTDRMFLLLGLGGTAFKKVYNCPLRMRPVSETVDAPDLIVNNAATDLSNAKRITHRVNMRPSTVRRLQLLGVYREVDLSTPMSPNLDAAQRAKKDQEGIQPDAMNPEDRDREIYECYCELDIKGFEHHYRGKVSGLEIPYRVTIDVSTQKILSIVRNYKEGEELPNAKKTFVKYQFVPGLGFYDIGLLQILGNTTNALTAAWREMLDNGMFANFPGFLIAKGGTRQVTNVMRVPPGGGFQVDTQGMKMGDAVMPLPYNTQQMPALMSLTTAMEAGGARIGGVSELQIGEGRPDAPVGTTLAMIEQATKILNSVHKRMHASQAEEFQLLFDCFRDQPESFWRRGCASGTQWSAETFMRALDDCTLVPQADPNTASHGQRMMKAQALVMWGQTNPQLADPVAIAKYAIQAVGFSNPEQFMAPPSAMGQPPPELLKMQADAKTAQQKADADTLKAQTDAKETDAKIQQGAFAQKGGLGGGQQQDTPVDQMMAKAKIMDAETKKQGLGLQAQQLQSDAHNQELDRQAERHSDLIDLAKEIMSDPTRAQQGASQVQPIEREIGI